MSEHLDLDVRQPLGTCAKCRREVVTGEPRLDMAVVVPDFGEVEITVCRACLSEYAPEALAAIEHDATQGLSL